MDMCLKIRLEQKLSTPFRIVYRGEKYIDKSLVSLLFSDLKRKDKKEAMYFRCSIKKRNGSVIIYFKGLSNKEIGEQLYLSEKTVKNYATNLFRKINVNDRVHATIVAIENQVEEYYQSKLEASNRD